MRDRKDARRVQVAAMQSELHMARIDRPAGQVWVDGRGWGPRADHARREAARLLLQAAMFRRTRNAAAAREALRLAREVR